MPKKCREEHRKREEDEERQCVVVRDAERPRRDRGPERGLPEDEEPSAERARADASEDTLFVERSAVRRHISTVIFA